MTPNKRDLKAYARFDGTGRIVPGSLVLRRQKPKVGKWIETQTYECCNFDQNPVTIILQGGTFPWAYPDFVLQGNGISEPYLFSYSPNSGPVNNLAELVASLNNDFSYYGKFHLNGEDVYLIPSAAIAQIFAAAGVTELVGYTFPD